MRNQCNLKPLVASNLQVNKAFSMQLRERGRTFITKASTVIIHQMTLSITLIDDIILTPQSEYFVWTQCGAASLNSAQSQVTHYFRFHSWVTVTGNMLAA